MKNGYLGIYDSGIGGLTVVKAVQEAFPNEKIVFLADSKHMPYGSKTPEEIVSYSLENVSILSRYPLKAVLIACNTSDSIAREVLQERCSLPIIGVISPAAKKAVSLSQNRRIAVMATQATCASGAYVKAVSGYDEEAEVISVPCPALVPLIEEGRFLHPDEELDTVLSSYLDQVKESGADTLILGCTHYDVLITHVKRILPGIHTVSSSRCFLDDLKELVSSETDDTEEKEIFLCTSDAEDFRKTAELMLPGIRFQRV